MSEQQDKQSKTVAKWFQKQTELMQQINDVEQQIEKLLQERSKIPYKPEFRLRKLRKRLHN